MHSLLLIGYEMPQFPHLHNRSNDILLASSFVAKMRVCRAPHSARTEQTPNRRQLSPLTPGLLSLGTRVPVDAVHDVCACIPAC